MGGERVGGRVSAEGRKGDGKITSFTDTWLHHLTAWAKEILDTGCLVYHC